MPVMVADALVVDDEQRAVLEVMARSTSLAHRQAGRARAASPQSRSTWPPQWSR
jgi:hypothetical protein